MTFSNWKLQLPGLSNTAASEGKAHEIDGCVATISDRASEWNKLALMILDEAEKLPSNRRKVIFRVTDISNTRAITTVDMSMSDWNKLALSLQERTSK